MTAKRDVTLQSIAHRVGVSKMAVSLALNGKAGVSDQLREKILGEARELGYRPNRLAKGLVSRRSWLIGFVVVGFADNYNNEVLRGVENCITDKGYKVVLGVTENDPAREAAVIETLNEFKLEGLIAFHSRNSETYRGLQKKGVPFVLFCKYFRDLQTDYVVADDIAGGYMAVRHLLEKGHRRIGYVHDARYPKSTEIEDRQTGFLRAMEEEGLTVSDQLLIPYLGYDKLAETLSPRILRERQITALFVCNDITAVRVMRFLHEQEVAIPAQVAIVGYEDVSLSQITTPPLTTVRTPQRNMGSAAAEMLIRRIEGYDGPYEGRKLAPELIVRGSV